MRPSHAHAPGLPVKLPGADHRIGKIVHRFKIAHAKSLRETKSDRKP